MQCTQNSALLLLFPSSSFLPPPPLYPFLAMKTNIPETTRMETASSIHGGGGIYPREKRKRLALKEKRMKNECHLSHDCKLKTPKITYEMEISQELELALPTRNEGFCCTCFKDKKNYQAFQCNKHYNLIIKEHVFR